MSVAGLARNLALLLMLAATECGNVIVGTPSAQTVPLRIHGSPPDATVTIDDQRVGSLSLVAARGIRVLPGRHRISVEEAGYLPFDVAVEAKDAVVPVEVKLVPVPD
ncbi:MAG: PEGA domain-containing protein [Polyangiaceae bacterium]